MFASRVYARDASSRGDRCLSLELRHCGSALEGEALLSLIRNDAFRVRHKRDSFDFRLTIDVTVYSVLIL